MFLQIENYDDKINFRTIFATMIKQNLLGFSPKEIKESIDELPHKFPSYISKQIAEWIYKKHAVSFSEMTNISAANRAVLDENFSVGIVPPVETQISKDGSSKYLFGDVETVLIPSSDRLTLCVSSQAGCKMNCAFCATGKMGFIRNLSVTEILNQFAFLDKTAAGSVEADGHTITNIVFMGMGEPLDNLSNVLQALKALTSDWGFALSPRRITVSTIGILPALKQLIEETECHIAISLHSPLHEQRLSLMPVEKVYPIEEVVAFLTNYDWQHQRKLSFEYVMLDGINDSILHAKALWKLVRDIPFCHINLIPYNPHNGSAFGRSNDTTIETFRNFLTEKNIGCTVRTSRGQDIDAACGLLASKQ